MWSYNDLRLMVGVFWVVSVGLTILVLKLWKQHDHWKERAQYWHGETMKHHPSAFDGNYLYEYMYGKCDADDWPQEYE